MREKITLDIFPDVEYILHGISRPFHIYLVRSGWTCSHGPCQMPIPILLRVLGPSTALSSSPGGTSCLHALEAVLGDSADLLATARVAIPSWRSWTACATSVASNQRTMLSTEMLIKAKCKTARVKSPLGKKKNKRDEGWMGRCSSSSPLVYFINNKGAETD